MTRFLTLILAISVVSCAAPPQKEVIKDAPSFSTQISSPELRTITEAYFGLSMRNNIVFKRNVSIGFSHIRKGNVIGYCTYGRGFREIDLDIKYWKKASWESKLALVFHEMTHCYCRRDHDFDNGEMYPDSSLKALLQEWQNQIPFSPLKPRGYLEDSCPKSIMHPVIVDDECFKAHYNYYVKEMFARCVPY